MSSSKSMESLRGRGGAIKIVAIKKMSAGNESVGEMWTETKIFEPSDTLSDVMDWIKNEYGGYSDKDIILTIAKEARGRE